MANSGSRKFSVALIVLISVCYVHNTAQVEEKRLSRSDRCPGLVISQTHCYRTLEVRSLLECGMHCRPDSPCQSVSFDGTMELCYLCNATSGVNCSNMERGVNKNTKYFESEIKCEETGQTMGPDGECVCAEGFRGKPCAPYNGDCKDLYDKGIYTTPGEYTIHPLLSDQPFSVYCKKLTNNNNTRTNVLVRSSDTTSFNRNFSEYQAGFGDLENDHWLGLEKLYQLTNSRSYELRVSCRLENGSNVFMLYQHFQITGSADGYRMLFRQTRDNSTYFLGDCFTPLLGAKFSAYDNDNDENNKVNCAEKHEGGWWFRGENCSTCNPTGPLLKSPNGTREGIDAEAFWTHDLGDAALYVIYMYLIQM
ncbi:microfibril-associated glycoprotein 4-like [Littorina saxatilis]|uniref:Fibrinogen C-terminal domain-containing protein n=1 Tax=Littorina saxatilis TaxID=31220 RepID=A0AAN9C8N2_9CAEN